MSGEVRRKGLSVKIFDWVRPKPSSHLEGDSCEPASDLKPRQDISEVGLQTPIYRKNPE